MALLQDQFEGLKCCVLIPTYNNATKLIAVLEDVLQYTHSVILINDGSTDNTKEILNEYPNLQCLSFPENRGKGSALIAGIAKAGELGYEYAISIDSDGQHLAKDFQLFLDKIKLKPNSLIVGARNMAGDEIPGGSSFGHKFSNFWFKLETGKELPDTQSGFRLYPVSAVNSRRFFSNRYEFEIESLVRLSWAGIELEWVPIQVIYPEDRITHFRKFWDFFRISILNSLLVLVALFWIKPRDLYRKIRNGEAKQIFMENILRTQDSNRKMAVGIGFGILMGIFPIWGFQMLVAVFLAALFRLNKAIVLLAANISIPPVIPFLLYFSYLTGGVLLNKSESIPFNRHFSFENIQSDLLQYYVGAVVFAVLAGVLTGLISYVLLAVFRKDFTKKALQNKMKTD
jgi:glycosyltransferase involved in cell wall biosynthesis